MENLEVSSAREIEASLRERLDTESIADVREAAEEEARSAEEAMVTAEAMAAAGMVPEPGPRDAEDTLSGVDDFEPAEEEPEVQETGPPADEQPTAVIRTEGSEPLQTEAKTLRSWNPRWSHPRRRTRRTRQRRFRSLPSPSPRRQAK